MIVQSCASTKLVDEGETAYQQGNYQTALEKWEEVIKEKEQKLEKVDSSLYYKAGMAAWELDRTAKARQYLESADETGYASPEMYRLLAGMYNNIDNLTLEIDALESYHKNYPEGEHIDSLNKRLFETFMESEQWNKAEALWPELEEQAKTKLEMQKAYFTVNKALDNDEHCDRLANQILEKDPEHLPALEWNAIKYFEKADNLYIKVMKAYDEKRTRENYNKLLKAWDVIWPDFETARDYFKRLYKLNPKPEYATYLGHIYKRMDKEQKAEYWYKQAEKGG